jgi:hypothetical protein
MPPAHRPALARSVSLRAGTGTPCKPSQHRPPPASGGEVAFRAGTGSRGEAAQPGATAATGPPVEDFLRAGTEIRGAARQRRPTTATGGFRGVSPRAGIASHAEAGRRPASSGARTAASSKGRPRGELTLLPGDPTVRINRQHNMTLNLKLRVRVFHSREIAGNARAAGGGVHSSGPRKRPIPPRWRFDRPQARWAGTR